MKRILILGVNGFIGHHLSKRIIATPRLDMPDQPLPASAYPRLLLIQLLQRIGERVAPCPARSMALS